MFKNDGDTICTDCGYPISLNGQHILYSNSSSGPVGFFKDGCIIQGLLKKQIDLLRDISWRLENPK